MIRKAKNQTGLDNNTYKAMYPMGCSVPKLYALPRSTSQTPPQAYSVQHGIGHLWSGQGTKILKPLVGKSATTYITLRTLLNRPIR